MIIVAQVEERTFGLLVDSVSDILDVNTDDMRQIPELDSNMADDFFNRVVVFDERIICEVVPEKLMPEEKELAA